MKKQDKQIKKDEAIKRKLLAAGVKEMSEETERRIFGSGGTIGILKGPK